MWPAGRKFHTHASTCTGTVLAALEKCLKVPLNYYNTGMCSFDCERDVAKKKRERNEIDCKKSFRE